MALSIIVNQGTHVEPPLVTFEGHLCTVLIPFSKIGLKNTCEPLLLIVNHLKAVSCETF